MPLVEAALRELWRGSLAKEGNKIIAAFPDAMIEELAVEIEAEPNALASSLALWALQVAKARPLMPPVNLREELHELVIALEAAYGALVVVEQKLWRVSQDARDHLIALEQEQAEGEVADYLTSQETLNRQRFSVSRFTPGLKVHLSQLLLLAKLAADGVDVRRGPPKRNDLHQYVDWLADIFEGSSKHRAGRIWNVDKEKATGRFRPFCQRCINALDIPCGSLDKIVQQVAQIRRETPDSS